MFTSCSFDPTKNKLDYYKGEDCTGRFCKDLIEHGMKIINCEKNKGISLTDEENESYDKKKVCYICKKEFNTDELDTDENYENEFNSDKNDENEFISNENDKNEFNTDKND